MRLSRLALAAWFMVSIAVPAYPADAGGPKSEIAVTTNGASPMLLRAADLEKLPIVEADVAFMTANGEEKAHYKGVLL